MVCILVCFGKIDLSVLHLIHFIQSLFTLYHLPLKHLSQNTHQKQLISVQIISSKLEIKKKSGRT